MTVRERAKKAYQGEDTEAKPESRDMTEMPITPTRRREASLMDCVVGAPVGASASAPRPSRYSPLHQNAISQAEHKDNCTSHASFDVLLLVPEESLPFPETMECISRKGMMIMRSRRRSDMVH